MRRNHLMSLNADDRSRHCSCPRAHRPARGFVSWWCIICVKTEDFLWMPCPLLHNIPSLSRIRQSLGDSAWSYPKVILEENQGKMPSHATYPDIPSAYYYDELRSLNHYHRNAPGFRQLFRLTLRTV
jgi:hypothetical protein